MIVSEKVLTCADEKCGISFAVPAWWESGKRQTKTTFYCPNGHPQSFTAETEAERLQRELNNQRQQNARLEDEAREARVEAEKAKATTKRLKRRAAAGSCPCCKRSFSNMADHMAHQHPDWVKEQRIIPMRKRA